MTEQRKMKRWDSLLELIPPDSPQTWAEIGVDRAITTRELLAARPLLSVLMVDPWRAGVPGTPWWKSGSVMPSRPQSVFDRARKRAMDIARQYADRTQVMEMVSAEAAAIVSAHGAILDGVYIDGDHSSEGCASDITLWMPLVKPGGYVTGHDWDKPERGQVNEAVLSIFDRADVRISHESVWIVRLPEEDVVDAETKGS